MADNNTVEIVIPNQGLTVTEIVIVSWHKKEGERVEEGETLLDFESDKADMELPAPVSGILSKITATEGQTVAIGSLVGVITTS